jgi:hypothetical protein
VDLQAGRACTMTLLNLVCPLGPALSACLEPSSTIAPVKAPRNLPLVPAMLQQTRPPDPRMRASQVRITEVEVGAPTIGTILMAGVAVSCRLDLATRPQMRPLIRRPKLHQMRVRRQILFLQLHTADRKPHPDCTRTITTEGTQS